jgi:alpha-mannosidase
MQGSDTAATYRRTLQQRVNDPLIPLFGRAANKSGEASQDVYGQATFLQDPKGLPPNVYLLTLKDNGDGKILLRLAHIYQVCPIIGLRCCPLKFPLLK